MDDQSDESFEALLRYLRDTRGVDFTGYKRTSLMRRVGHQMKHAGGHRGLFVSGGRPQVGLLGFDVPMPCGPRRASRMFDRLFGATTGRGHHVVVGWRTVRELGPAVAEFFGSGVSHRRTFDRGDQASSSPSTSDSPSLLAMRRLRFKSR